MTTSISLPPRRALRTIDAARYLGVSPSLLRKMRSRGPADTLGVGPAYIRLSPSLIVYEISVLDSWLEAHALASARNGEPKRDRSPTQGPRS
jgi:hypothetical protein